jgi:hypothetical protein
MLTSSQKKAVQKAQRKNQQALTIIHQCQDDVTFKIVTNVTTANQHEKFCKNQTNELIM